MRTEVSWAQEALPGPKATLPGLLKRHAAIPTDASQCWAGKAGGSDGRLSLLLDALVYQRRWSSRATSARVISTRGPTVQVGWCQHTMSCVRSTFET